MSGTCKDCEHWDIESNRVFGQCELTRSAGNTPSAGVEHTKATAQNIAYARGHLRTHPDFGCNQFEEKSG